MSFDDFKARSDVFLARDAKLRVGVAKEAKYIRLVWVAVFLSYASVIAWCWPHPLSAASTLGALLAALGAWFVGKVTVSVWADRSLRRIMTEHPMPPETQRQSAERRK